MAIADLTQPDQQDLAPKSEEDSRARALSVGVNTNAVIAGLAVVAFLYFAKPIMLPVFMACYAAMTLKPITRWLAQAKIPAPVSAVLILVVLLGIITFTISRLKEPVSKWINEAPAHVTELRERAYSLYTTGPRINEAAAAITSLVAPTPDKAAVAKAAPVVEVKDTAHDNAWMTWTSSALEGVIATVILAYLLLAAGDLPMQKLVDIMPTLRDKKRAVEISREIQRAISNYLFFTTLVNLGLGVLVAAGLFFLGVPNAAMWGACAALLNYIPYFGPYVGIALVGIVGVLTFPTLGRGLLPAGWYILLHLLESNFVTPVFVGRKCLLNPVAIFVSLLFWTWLWGVPGAWLAVPVLVGIKVVCERTPSLATVGELVSA